MTSRSGSYFSTESPGCFSHLPIVPSATLSPSWGIVTLATFAVPPGSLRTGLVSPIRAKPVEPVEPGDALSLSVRHASGREPRGGEPRDRRPRASLAAARCRGLRVARGRPGVGRGRRQHARPEPPARATRSPTCTSASALISLVVAVALGAALGRTRKARLFGVALTSVAVALVVERIALSTGSTARPADPLADGHRRGHDRRHDRLDGRDVDVRRPPGETALPDLHGRGDRRLLRREPRGRAVGGARRHRITRRRPGDPVPRRPPCSSAASPWSRRGRGLGAAAGRAPADRRRRSSRVRRGPQVAADAARRGRLRAVLGPRVLRDVPVPARRRGPVPGRGGARLRRSARSRPR